MVAFYARFRARNTLICIYISKQGYKTFRKQTSKQAKKNKKITTFAPLYNIANRVFLSKTYRKLLLSSLVAIVVFAFLGKALHTHSSDYWQSLMQTEESADNGIADDCPICQYNLFFFLSFESATIALFATIIFTAFIPTVILRTKEVVRWASLRAPPAI